MWLLPILVVNFKKEVDCRLVSFVLCADLLKGLLLCDCLSRHIVILPTHSLILHLLGHLVNFACTALFVQFDDELLKLFTPTNYVSESFNVCNLLVNHRMHWIYLDLLGARSSASCA